MSSTKLYLNLIICLFLSPILTHAITPQKYCESLPATSCELLNTHYVLAASSSGTFASYIFKYCRNQVFKTAVYSEVSTSQQGVLRFDPNSYGDYCFGSGGFSISTTSLCSRLSTVSGSCPGPSKEFLP